MHYVSAEGLTKSYGINPLFKNISFHINEGDKIALIARNGVGKSTLLRILNGDETPDEGKLFIHKDVTVALFEQEPRFDESKTVLENIFHTDHPVMNVIRAYEMASEAEDGVALSELFGKMDDLNAWDFEVKVKQILTKLNIHHLEQPVRDLSGGQRKRVALAKTLIDIGFDHKHTLLMMDEPTNHLDVEMIEWLENYLNQENVTLLLVTHDRYFLDAVSEEIWELERENMYVYHGDYENYIEKKAARIESEQASIDKARNEYRKELEWMRKQPKARTTKSKSRQDNFYEVEARAKQRIEDAQLQLQVKMSRLGGKVVEMKKVYKSYGELPILKGFDYTFSKGERIGIIGKNGVGKSTFLNMLQQIEPADSGKINIGETVVFGNFSQQGLVIKENMRVIEYVKTFAENFPLANGGSLSAAQFLELFLFTPDKQYTYLNALSGGEKKRLQLLTILFTNPNFLILDEPTNDLDLPTLAVLENFLSDYQGCVLIVSHDRYFMDRLVDHLFVFEGGGEVRDFPGNYTQYRLWMKDNEKKENKWEVLEQRKSKGESTESAVAGRETPVAVQKEAMVKKKLSFKEKREFEQLEKELPELEAEKKQITEQMGSGNLSFEELNKMSGRILEIDRMLEEKELRWLELSEMGG
ncbi:MAG: ABC-F family ATP-binding cassette domain-containing protein [Chitinophagaceae bacterium]|nr:ABC-F family ATP-binding cassette domain-containing protein [Chitinophagaceae bacterium]MCA6454790.1 ABC-F family ATP-binding cassette domain-containing protein [Chitinophagaceae bacterium]MCA6459417.1 ABC-F family ATP-binding cassette domain-containing protein [Chitinophagaceae bacterium]MCA6464779.1 ABC-F family ATP-binding cassette domain-containing protein [Chitinophagaceae bacterium]MEA3424831.1 ABC-F family ATP-binding cassette domain-containing protein [Bacteroidota bacterium]